MKHAIAWLQVSLLVLVAGDCARHNPLVHRIPDVLPNAFVVSADGLGMADGDPWRVHFSRAAEIALGIRYADVMIAIQDR